MWFLSAEITFIEYILLKYSRYWAFWWIHEDLLVIKIFLNLGGDVIAWIHDYGSQLTISHNMEQSPDFFTTEILLRGIYNNRFLLVYHRYYQTTMEMGCWEAHVIILVPNHMDLAFFFWYQRQPNEWIAVTQPI